MPYVRYVVTPGSLVDALNVLATVLFICGIALSLRLHRRGQKAPWREPGDEGPAP